MGPKRDRDEPAGTHVPSLEPIELGPADSAAGGPATAADDEASAPAGRQHWLAGLLRADVLGLTAAALLVLTVVGLPFLGFAESMLLYMGPSTSLMAEAWVFVPVLSASAAAALLGLGALRQANRQDVSGWVPALAGSSALLGLLLTIGTIVVWLYANDSEVFDTFNRFF